MKNKLTQTWVIPLTWLRFLIIILLAIGVFFRFVNLDKKVYLHDEAVTSIRIGGYTRSEITQQIFNGDIIGVEDLQKYLRPNSEKGLSDTIRSLAIEDSQHPPLYYVMLRFWMQQFGSSVAVIRSLSAFISLLVFPSLYWLCLELFGSSLVGWVAIALIAISPFHLVYAQVAREFGLWTVTILLSSAALLQAMRLKTKFSWGIYAVTLAIGLYTFLFSGLVAIAHGIYVVISESFRLSKTVTAYLLASLVGILAYAPWIVSVITNSSRIFQTTDWTSEDLVLSSLVDKWLHNISFAFLHEVEGVLSLLLIPPILFIVGYSFYFLYRNAPQRAFLFVLSLTGVTALAVILPDLILGGVRSTVIRYVIPCYLGIQLSVAYLLATQITSISTEWQQKLWRFTIGAIVTLGVVSCTLISQAEITRINTTNKYNYPVARIINRADHPLLISSNYSSRNITHLLNLSYILKPSVKFQLILEPNTPKIPDSFNELFLFNFFKSSEEKSEFANSSETLLYRLQKEQNYKIDNIYENILWRLRK